MKIGATLVHGHIRSNRNLFKGRFVHFTMQTRPLTKSPEISWSWRRNKWPIKTRLSCPMSLQTIQAITQRMENYRDETFRRTHLHFQWPNDKLEIRSATPIWFNTHKIWKRRIYFNDFPQNKAKLEEKMAKPTQVTATQHPSINENAPTIPLSLKRSTLLSLQSPAIGAHNLNELSLIQILDSVFEILNEDFSTAASHRDDTKKCTRSHSPKCGPSRQFHSQ